MNLVLSETDIIDGLVAQVNIINVREALTSPMRNRWRIAMEEEINGLKRINSWVLVPRPAKVKVNPCHWILTIKCDHMGIVSAGQGGVFYSSRHIV